MSRLGFGGAEWKETLIEGLSSAGTVTIDATGPRSGVACYQFASGAASNLFFPITAVATHTYWARAWIYFSGNPAVDTPVAAWSATTNYQEVVTLTTAGKFQGTDGSTLTAALTPGFYCVEIKLTFTSTSSWSSEARINGVVLNTRSSHNPSATPNRFTFGNYSGTAHGITLRADDWAVNDDGGAAQNSYPGATEKILLAKPASDNTIGTDWKLGAGTTPSANAFDAVNNVPPVGVANASGTDGAQIRDAAASLTAPASDADLNVQSYTTAGVPAGSTITATQGVAAVALSSGGTGRSIALKVVSNPADGAETALTVSSGGGTFPTGWTGLRTTPTSNPTVTLGTSPVVRVGKRNTSATLDLCCALGVQFGYEPPATTTVVLGQATETDAAQAVSRLKRRTLTQATETDIGQAVARLKARTLGQATETDAAQAVSRLKSRTLAQALETDVAQPVARSKARTLGQAEETDAAQALTRLTVRLLGQAIEVDAAQSITGAKSLELGQAGEVDEAFAVAGSKTLLLGQAEEIDLAQAITVIVAAAALSTDGYTDAVVGILTVAPVTGIFTSPANRN